MGQTWNMTEANGSGTQRTIPERGKGHIDSKLMSFRKKFSTSCLSHGPFLRIQKSFLQFFQDSQESMTPTTAEPQVVSGYANASEALSDPIGEEIHTL